jgi:hypothetical protein
LEPLQKTALSAAFLMLFQIFMEHLLRQACIDLVSVCNPNFFSGEFLHALLSVTTSATNTNPGADFSSLQTDF